MGSAAPLDTNTRSGLATSEATLARIRSTGGPVALAATGDAASQISAAQARLDAADALKDTPDLTDDAVKKAKVAAQQKLLEGQGFGQMFLTGPLGLSGAPKAPTS